MIFGKPQSGCRFREISKQPTIGTTSLIQLYSILDQPLQA